MGIAVFLLHFHCQHHHFSLKPIPKKKKKSRNKLFKQNNTHKKSLQISSIKLKGSMKNQALGFSKINIDKMCRLVLGWEVGDRHWVKGSIKINTAGLRRWEIGADQCHYTSEDQHRSVPPLHQLSSILAGFEFVLGK